MKYIHKQAVFALITISITAAAVILVYIQMVNITKEIANKHSVASAGSVLDDTCEQLENDLKKACDEEALRIYNDMLAERNRNTGRSDEKLPGSERGDYYNRYVQSISSVFGTGDKLIFTLRDYIPGSETGSIVIADAPPPTLSIDYDETSAVLKEIGFKDVILGYMKDGMVIEQKSCTFDISVNEVGFAPHPVRISDYSMAGSKGIYITGGTSSVVGNIYAGTHEFDEGSEEEAVYGEKDPYGGINILTTQLGIYADTIASSGDINIKGAFVIMGSEEEPVLIYANALNDIESYPDKTEYTITGHVFKRDGASGFTDPEYYEEITGVMNRFAAELNGITDTYSSSEDEDYTGEYDLIISPEDVIIDKDLTGAVLTSGNITVRNGVNTEGLLAAGGRIYIEGNNNIVSNSEIVDALAGFAPMLF